MLLSKAEVDTLGRIAVALGEPPSSNVTAMSIFVAIERRIANENDDDDDVTKRLKTRIHLLQQEIDGLRETVEGLERAITGAGKSYRAARQSVDLLEKDILDVSGDLQIALSRVKALSADVERLQLERLRATSGTP